MSVPGQVARVDSAAVDVCLMIEGQEGVTWEQWLALAQTAESAENVGGFSNAYFTEIIEHVGLDGAGPGNTDPSEGLADVDGDGRANFVDADNDADGLNDGTEVLAGSNINLVTPVISSFAPPVSLSNIPQTITVTGANFEPGISVAFGSENP